MRVMKKGLSVLMVTLLMLGAGLSGGIPVLAEDGTEGAALSDEGTASGETREAKPAIGEAIFINGAQGDDSKDGTSKESAVKTFAKVKEIATANPQVKTIYMTGTVDASGELSLENTQAKIQREESFGGYLFSIKKGNAASLKAIVIDGNGEAPKAKKSLIEVSGSLDILDGAVLQNNKIVNAANTRSWGGAIYSYQGNVRMRGGLIQDNQAVEGGGIVLLGAKMEFAGGAIQNNNANRLYDADVRQYYGSGGGILLKDGAVLDMKGNALVKNNTAAETGGGISVGSRDWSDRGDLFTMRGGILEGNEAGAAGGGLFVQAGLNGRVSKAEISAGQIIRNKMNGTGRTEKQFGGGGIYVNGMPPRYMDLSWTSGELHLTNVAVVDNEARIAGGGMAACPVSRSYIYAKDGGAIYNNRAREAKDFYVLSNKYYGAHGGEPYLSISDRMLGGKPYDWKDENGDPVDVSQYDKIIPHGEEVKLHTEQSYSEEEIGKLAKVIIKENTSTTRGGGIGSNGTVYIGTDKPKKDVEVVKSWAKGLEPEEVEIELRAKKNDIDWLIETVKLNKQNGFKHVFRNLPEQVDGQDMEALLYIKEIHADKYKAEISAIKEVAVPKTLSFRLDRPQFSANESVSAVYSNYHMSHPETGVFNKDKWALNDFEVKHILDDGAGNKRAEGTMSYTADSYSWNGEASFSGVPVETEKVEVQYYDDNGSFVAPWLLEYKVHLQKQGDKTILKVPNLWPQNVANPTGADSERVIKVKDLKVEGSANRRFQIAITNKAKQPWTPMEPAKTKLKVEKVWRGEDAEAQAAIKVFLVKNGVKTTQSVVLSKENGWKGEFAGLPHTDSLTAPANVYTVVEEGERDGKIGIGEKSYQVTYDKGVVTNTLVNPKISVAGEKRWEDGDNQDGIRPSEVTITLVKNGKVTDITTKATAKSEWKYAFRDLDTYDENGKKIVYTVKEHKVEGYETEVDGTTITNVHRPKEVEIFLTKNWVDDANKRLLRPEQIKVDLYADGEKVKTIAVKADESGMWRASFGKLPVNKAGKEIRYTVKEAKVERYTMTGCDGSAKEGFTITNKLVPKPGVPKTGDNKDIFLYASLMALTATMLFAAMKIRRRYNR